MIITFDSNITHQDATVKALEALLRENNISYSSYMAPLSGGPRLEYQIVSSVEVPLQETIVSTLGGRAELCPHHSPFPRVGIHPNGERFAFEYNGVRFDDNTFNLFPGLCAVDSEDSAIKMMQACQAEGLDCTRMGAFKPRTSPYSFQGLGAECLPYVFEAAGKYGIKVIAMEVLEAADIERIDRILEGTGRPTGVMLQIGTRNCQNVSLLKAVGSQQTYPVLLKRGFGISLHESLFAAEHIAAAGNCQVVFCLRGLKSIGAAPHRNLVDFGHVSTVKRLTRLGVCADPSHSAGARAPDNCGISDIQHVSAQAVIAGANMILVDFHPDPSKALCDGHQALSVEQLPRFVQDMHLCRETFIKRCKISEQ